MPRKKAAEVLPPDGLPEPPPEESMSALPPDSPLPEDSQITESPPGDLTEPFDAPVPPEDPVEPAAQPEEASPPDGPGKEISLEPPAPLEDPLPDLLHSAGSEEPNPAALPAVSLDDLLADPEDIPMPDSTDDMATLPPADHPGDDEDGPAATVAEEARDAEETPRPAVRRTTRRRRSPEHEPEPASPLSGEPRTRRFPEPATASFAPGILSIDAKAEVETEEYREDTIWHEIRNAYRTRRILTGTLGGVEQTDDGKSLVIVEFKGYRVVIPAKEMMLTLGTGRRPSGNAYADLMRRQNQILSAMMGAEIDFIVRGIDNRTRSIVASRKEAILKKRQIFYLDQDASGSRRITAGRLAQARVIAVAEKVVRVEVFGVECAILARDLAWDWMSDAHERFSVGDRIVVRVLEVQCNSLEDITIRADVKSASSSTDLDNLKKCRIQGKYAGKVTNVHKGVVFVRLTNGVNAIAHACLDRRMPGKMDDVSFAVTHIDVEQGIALGIITRIIKQNL